MKYLEKSFSVGTYKPNPAQCCEACVFGSGEHSDWCEMDRLRREGFDRLKRAAREINERYGPVFTT